MRTLLVGKRPFRMSGPCRGRPVVAAHGPPFDQHVVFARRSPFPREPHKFKMIHPPWTMPIIAGSLILVAALTMEETTAPDAGEPL